MSKTRLLTRQNPTGVSELLTGEKFTPLETFRGDEYFLENEKKFKCVLDNRVEHEVLWKSTIRDAFEDDLKCMFALHLLKMMEQTTFECSEGMYELERISRVKFRPQSHNAMTFIELSIVYMHASA